MLPRLRGWGEAMSRQAATGGGGIGALRGPGETKLEVDRRRIRTQMARYAYLLNYPIVVRVGWSLMRLLLRFTPWRNRDYVPARLPEFRLTPTAESASSDADAV